MTDYAGAMTIGTSGTSFDMPDSELVMSMWLKACWPWKPQLLATTAVLACAFSPTFADDEGICAVVTDDYGASTYDEVLLRQHH